MISKNSVLFVIVAIFVTLFAAVQVNGETGCQFTFDFVSDLDLECNDLKNSWVEESYNLDGKNRKILFVPPEKNACIKTKDPVVFRNASFQVVVKYFRDGKEKEKVTVRMIPKEGDCREEDCVWDLSNDGQYKQGEWATATHNFPLQVFKEYYVQLQVQNGEGKFFLEHIHIPAAVGGSKRCKNPEEEAEAAFFRDIAGTTTHAPAPGPTPAPTPGGNGSNNTNGTSNHTQPTSRSPGLLDVSKNLILTSASLLTLNKVLN